ncbi:MAG: ribonuclease R [Solitalea-like symbiont of Acarus siro]
MTNKNKDKAISIFAKMLLIKNIAKLFNYKFLKLKFSNTKTSTINETKSGKKYKNKQNFNKKVGNSHITGTLYLNNYTKSYVANDQHKIYISKRNTSTALHRDLVEVYCQNPEVGKANRITKILKRSKIYYVGILRKDKDDYYLHPDDNKVLKPIIIPKERIKNTAVGTKVVVKITMWKSDKLVGEIKNILGVPGDSDVENKAIIAELGFSEKFPKNVQDLANSLDETISKAEIKDRYDFRDTTTFTIDPIDAKDFDDAISIKTLDTGNYQIGVHIADVSQFVKEDDLLDIEAQKRATSVYLVDGVIPMLPERLSNNLCSLKPNVDRLTFSVVFEITKDYKIKNYSIHKAIIHSNKRFTYEEVQEILDKKKGLFYNELNILNNIAKALRKNRIRNGSINFHSQEVKFVLDKDKNPIDIIIKIQKDAHKLIEEFMLLANKTVAEAVGKNFFKKPKTFVYRAHEAPGKEDLKKFGSFISTFGYKISMANNNSTRHSFNKLMEDIKNKDEEYLISQLAIRAMNKAYYSTKVKYHYGLALDYYTHFTSPIRRYPDIMSHRLLNYYLNRQDPKDINKYEAMCEHSSIMEKKAVDAEMSKIKLQQIAFLENKVGNKLSAIISGVTEWGIYVELIDNGCEGMIGVKSFKNNKLRLNDNNNVLVDSDGKMFRIGDKLSVQLIRVDSTKRHIDFKLC